MSDLDLATLYYLAQLAQTHTGAQLLAFSLMYSPYAVPTGMAAIAAGAMYLL